MEKPKVKVTFNPTISFDGVAIIVACVTASVWFGSLSATIKQHAESIRHIEQIQEAQSESHKIMSQNIAVLTTLVNERTKLHP